MDENAVAKSLHDKSTRGGVLTAEEQAILASWYAHLDQEEAAMFARNAAPQPGLTQLRHQVNAAAAELVAGAQRIQTLVAENETLRKEIAAIEQQLGSKNVAQPA